jgi:hypothetical protein
MFDDFAITADMIAKAVEKDYVRLWMIWNPELAVKFYIILRLKVL